MLTAQLALPASKYPANAPEKLVAFEQQVLDRVRGLPGVTSAAFTTSLPFGGLISDGFAEIETVGAVLSIITTSVLIASVFPARSVERKLTVVAPSVEIVKLPA